VDAGPRGGGVRTPWPDLSCLHGDALRGSSAGCGRGMQAGVSAPRPTHFLCWCKESKPRNTWNTNAACGGWRWCRSLRSSRWCAAVSRSRRSTRARTRSQRGARQLAGPLASSVSSKLCESCRIAALATSEGAGRVYSERSDARWATGSRVPALRCPNGLAGGALQSHSRPCRAPAARDRAHHRPERSDRCLPPTTARRIGIEGAFLAYFLCTSKESESAAGPKPPPAMASSTPGRRPAKRTAMPARHQQGPAPC
jgi:hypothetical protein